jgi:site-specific DNA-methyltransferase (adenine-specific)
MSKTKLMQGDNIESLKKLPDNSIDSIVTDPPYGLSFMNKKWDHQVPSVDFWKEVYRVLKPGGHVLSFGGTRTYHRMTVNIEDAGFEIRDQIMWLYGSGFPKSMNIGKTVDKLRGNKREVIATRMGDDITGGNMHADRTCTPKLIDVTKGTSEWEGWGTALKPANEPICVARKPISEKTITANVLKWGTGGINIDGCRVKIEGEDDRSAGIRTATFGSTEYVSGGNGTEPYIPNEEGRFPANIILDEEAGMALDEQSGISGSLSTKKKTTRKRKYEAGGGSMMANREDIEGIDNYGDKGGASRFFYCPKVSKKERNAGCDDLEEKENKEVFGKGFSTSTKLVTEEQINSGIVNRDKVKNNHPTVKPISLMAYLCRLVTPPNGIVLDPFMGSGSTGIAARIEGFRFVGMEMDEDYFEIAKKRIEHYNGKEEGTKV